MSTPYSVVIGLNPFPAYVRPRTPDGNAAAHAQALLREDQRITQILHPNSIRIRRDHLIEAFTPSPVPLALVASEAVLTPLPEDVASQLRGQMAQLLKRYREELPCLEGDVVETLDLAILTAPYQSFPSGSLVVLRSSHLADVQFIMPWIRVDRRHGIPVVQGLAEQVEAMAAQPTGLVQYLIDPRGSTSESLIHPLTDAAMASDPKTEQKLLGASLWDYISQIGGCVIWVAPAPWNAIGAGTITALRLFFADASGSDRGQNLLASIFESVRGLVGGVNLSTQMAVFSDYNNKLAEIKGLIDQWCRDQPLSNQLIDDQHWLADGVSGLANALSRLERATQEIYATSEILDPKETLGYHSAYVMGVLFQVQCSGMIAKMHAQYAANIGQCEPPDLNVETFSLWPDAAPRIADPRRFLDATAKFQEAYIVFRNRCVGYVDQAGQLQPGKYQEISQLAHDIWYRKIKALTGVIAYTVSNMYNETWWRYGAWVDVDEEFNSHPDEDLAISDDDKKRVDDLFDRLRSKADADFWAELIRFQAVDSGRLSSKQLIAFCKLVKGQRCYEAEKWPIYSELQSILDWIDWENPAGYNGVNPIDHASSWIAQFTNANPRLPRSNASIWWKGPANVDADKKVPQPLCLEVAAEVLELFLTRQYRTSDQSYAYQGRPSVLEKHRVESDRSVHNICCTDQYEVSFTDHFDQVIVDRDKAFADYLKAFNLDHMVDTARQIHDSVYSASSLMAPLPPRAAPALRANGSPPPAADWKPGNKVWYRYCYRNSAGPSSASPEVSMTIDPSQGVQLTLAADPLEEATQFLVYRRITDTIGNLVQEYKPIGGGKITPLLKEPPRYNDFR